MYSYLPVFLGQFFFQISSKRLKKTQEHRQITVYLFCMDINDYVIADTIFGSPVFIPSDFYFCMYSGCHTP